MWEVILGLCSPEADFLSAHAVSWTSFLHCELWRALCALIKTTSLTNPMDSVGPIEHLKTSPCLSHPWIHHDLLVYSFWMTSLMPNTVLQIQRQRTDLPFAHMHAHFLTYSIWSAFFVCWVLILSQEVRALLLSLRMADTRMLNGGEHMLLEMAYWFLFMMIEIVVMEKAMHRYVSSHKQAILSVNQIAGSIISSLKGLSIYYLGLE